MGASGGRAFVSTWGQALFGPTLQTGQWYHVAATSSGGNFKLFVDGEEVASGVMPLQTAAGSSLYLGRLDASRRLDGRQDEVLVYNRALSPQEISGLYHAGAANFAVANVAPTPSIVSIGAVGWKGRASRYGQCHRPCRSQRHAELLVAGLQGGCGLRDWQRLT